MAGMSESSGSAGGSGSWIGPAMQVGGSLLSAYGSHQQAGGQQQSGADTLQYGQQQRALAQFQAAQMRANAGKEIASSQRQSDDIQQRQDYIASRALAVAAASGGGASDPTVINLIARVAGEGAYRKSVAVYEGAERAHALEMQARATEMGGQMAYDKAAGESRAYGTAASNTNIGASSTLLKGASTLYSRFAGGGPNNGGTNDGMKMPDMTNWGGPRE